MNFYESIMDAFFEKLRASAQLSQEEALLVLAELMKDSACQALEKIRAVLDDDRLDDPECFWRFEEIVKIYEEVGSDGGSRHDF